MLNQIKELAGSIYTNIDAPIIDGLLTAYYYLYRSCIRKIENFELSLGRNCVPTYDEIDFLPLELTKNNKNYYPINNTVKSIATIGDKIIKPSKLLIHGTDYTIDNGSLVFKDDVFSIYEKSIVDNCLTLFGQNVRLHSTFMYDNYGVVFNIYGKDCDSYHNLIKLLYEMKLSGTYKGYAPALIAALEDIPISKHDDETVEEIFKHNDKNLIITDKEVYSYDTPVMVEIGEDINRFTLLFHLKLGDISNLREYMQGKCIPEDVIQKLFHMEI